MSKILLDLRQRVQTLIRLRLLGLHCLPMIQQLLDKSMGSIMTNCVDPDKTPQKAASDLGLHCLFRPDCFKFNIQPVDLFKKKLHNE